MPRCCSHHLKSRMMSQFDRWAWPGQIKADKFRHIAGWRHESDTDLLRCSCRGAWHCCLLQKGQNFEFYALRNETPYIFLTFLVKPSRSVAKFTPITLKEWSQNLTFLKWNRWHVFVLYREARKKNFQYVLFVSSHRLHRHCVSPVVHQQVTNPQSYTDCWCV